jgi:ATP-dependent DNA helicase RecQ
MKRVEREAAQRAFDEDAIDVIVATNAFGLGIDKAGVRWVLHADTPPTLDEYYQEIGRAGRDDLPAAATLFYDPADIARQKFRTGAPSEEERLLARSRLEMMRTFCETTACRRSHVLSYLGEPFEPPCHRCDNCDKRDTQPVDTSPTYLPGAVVHHHSWGRGTVMQSDQDIVTVLFDTAGYRNLSLELIAERGLLTTGPARPSTDMPAVRSTSADRDVRP